MKAKDLIDILSRCPEADVAIEVGTGLDREYLVIEAIHFPNSTERPIGLLAQEPIIVAKQIDPQKSEQGPIQPE